jgi:hypothetical protein
MRVKPVEASMHVQYASYRAHSICMQPKSMSFVFSYTSGAAIASRAKLCVSAVHVQSSFRSL